MRVPITVPNYQLGDEPLRLGEWSVGIGDDVEIGDSIAELICPGMVIDLITPASGVVRELLRQPEHLVVTGEILGWIEGHSSD